MTVEHVFAGLPVVHLDVALEWYARLFDRPPDLVPNEREAAWHVADAAWIVVIHDAKRAGTAKLTIMVDDLDELIEALVESGIGSTPVEKVTGKFRRTVVTDPGGNSITFGQSLA